MWAHTWESVVPTHWHSLSILHYSFCKYLWVSVQSDRIILPRTFIILTLKVWILANPSVPSKPGCSHSTGAVSGALLEVLVFSMKISSCRTHAAQMCNPEHCPSLHTWETSQVEPTVGKRARQVFDSWVCSWIRLKREQNYSWSDFY